MGKTNGRNSRNLGRIITSTHCSTVLYHSSVFNQHRQTRMVENFPPGTPAQRSCECSRDGGGRGVQFVPDSAGASVADVALSPPPLGLGCTLAGHSSKRPPGFPFFGVGGAAEKQAVSQ